MRRNGLRRARAAGITLAGALALAACRAAPPPDDEPLTASRAEVALALHRQLALVLERHRTLDDAEAEREALFRLALEIAIRILRVDPAADLDGISADLRSGARARP